MNSLASICLKQGSLVCGFSGKLGVCLPDKSVLCVKAHTH